jgi:hypothetical protein
MDVFRLPNPAHLSREKKIEQHPSIIASEHSTKNSTTKSSKNLTHAWL